MRKDTYKTSSLSECCRKKQHSEAIEKERLEVIRTETRNETWSAICWLTKNITINKETSVSNMQIRETVLTLEISRSWSQGISSVV